MFSEEQQTKGVRRKLLLVSVGSALLGLSLLGVKAMNTAAHEWKPVEVALPAEAGTIVNTTFVAELDQYYEIILEFNSGLPEAQLRQLLEEVRDPPTVDVAWSIARDGKDVAVGSSATILYTSSGGRSKLGQIKKLILSSPHHRGRGSFVQVVGRFRAEAGQTYRITAELRALDPALSNTSPRLGMQLNRELWAAHSKGMRTFAYTGLLLIGISVALFAAWIAVALFGNRRGVGA